MLRRVCFAALVLLLCLFICKEPGLLYAQQTSKKSIESKTPINASEMDARDQRKLAKIAKLEEFKNELGEGAIQPDSFKKMEGILISFLQDPDSEGLLKYEVLLQLSDLYMRSMKKENVDKAVHYLLRAALEDPDRVEAYLRLAQIYGDLGESQTQSRYLTVAHQIVASRGRYADLADRFRKLGDAQQAEYYENQQQKAPQSLEAWYLLGQYYLDRANYYALLSALRPVVFNKSSSYYWGDPYLINQMYQAATLDLNTYQYWAPPLWGAINRVSPSKLEEKTQRFFQKSYNIDNKKTVIAKYLRDDLMPYLRNSVDVTAYHETVDPALGTRSYRLKPLPLAWGSPQSPLQLDKPLDQLLPELFVRASVSSSPVDPPEMQMKKEEEVRRLTDRIEELKKVAQEKCGAISDQQQKARALFEWLKNEVLVNYALVEGIPAENVLDPNKKKYLCLTGAIMYTLLGRHLGLDVVGCIGPGHAYCRFNHHGRAILVETTDKNGFDYKTEEKRHQSGDGAKYGGLLFTREMDGPVSPWELVSCQFSNVANNLPRLLILENPSYRALAVKVFSSMPRVMDQIKEVREEFERVERKDPAFKWEGRFTPEDCLQTWFLTPLGDEGLIQLKLISDMSEENPNFKKDVTAKYEESLEVLARGMQVEPFGVFFRQNYIRQLRLLDAIETQSSERKMVTLGTAGLSALRDLAQEIEDLQGKLKSDQSGDGENIVKLTGSYADVEKRIQEKRDKFFSLLKDYTATSVERASSRLSSLERRQAAIKYCPPIPELGQEYLKSINSLYRELGEITIYCDALRRIWPEAPEQDLQSNLRRVQDLKMRLERLASAV